MRIRQLDLLRYGHFTDAIIALPAGKPDFQMLLGENEAGKSTAMNGVEDLLFGFGLVLTSCVAWTWLGRSRREEAR